ncbi:MAG: peptide chain release factor N(5)-glutamine methyltransferase [Bacteroidales bacterium]|jgi:release factor glutamine methyltransferase|nr:peptide chain release factor N(5)-glutamine methyltransferase [Bacteroidales bacterium]
MQTVIQYIEKELQGLYPKTEIKSLIRLIIEHIYGFNYTQFLLHRDTKSGDDETVEIKLIVERLKKFEPVQYILGETEFHGLKLKVNKSVLIPRPETEELVQWVLNSGIKLSSIIDIGTGSGCIALALKNKMPETKVTAIDFSAEALKTAKQNAIQNNIEINFIEADIFDWEKFDWEKFDVIVSNPPYVREIEKAKMEPNVLNYEPLAAIFVPDTNPLVFYRAIACFAKKYLKNEGLLFFEINESLASEIETLLVEMQFHNIEIKKDINGKFRMVRCLN